MNFNRILTIVAAGLLAMGVSAQNLQSASALKNKHDKLLANQERALDKIRAKAVDDYARGLYDDEEPEPDIYTEGWDSGLVNPFKESDVPSSKVIDVTGYRMPISGNYVTSHYGYRPRFGRNHKGVDLRAPMGDTVRAAFSGKVRLTKFERNGFGFYVILRHENGLETVYGHLSRFLVQPDQYVKAGQPIALSGSTGRSTGPHLHFETRFMGYAINPEAIFDFENRVTHTDSYTFQKNNYTQARNYSPSHRYTSIKHGGKKSAHMTKKARGKRSSARSTYKVKSGDNLSTIAKRNGTTVAQLRKLNGIKGNKVQKGRVIRVK